MDKPQDLLKLTLHNPVQIWLSNGQIVFGVIRSVDQIFNITLSDCTYYKDQQVFSINNMSINGKHVQAVRISEQAVQEIEKKLTEQITITTQNQAPVIKSSKFSLSTKIVQ